MQLKNIILYWLTACEDLQRPEDCKKCFIYEECLTARQILYGRDVLKDKTYRLQKGRLIDKMSYKLDRYLNS